MFFTQPSNQENGWKGGIKYVHWCIIEISLKDMHYFSKENTQETDWARFIQRIYIFCEEDAW